MLLTVDSSVVIAGIIENEARHQICKQLMTRLAKAEYTAVAPYTVLVEIAGALKRRTGSDKLAEKTWEELQRMETVNFFELTKDRANEAAILAMKLGLKGMDAVVVQIAKENNTGLVTLDDEIAEKVKGIVRIISVEDVSLEE